MNHEGTKSTKHSFPFSFRKRDMTRGIQNEKKLLRGLRVFVVHFPSCAKNGSGKNLAREQKSVDVQIVQLYISYLKGGNKRHGKESKEDDQEVVQEDDEEGQEVICFCSDRARGSFGDARGLKVTHFVLGPGSKSRATKHKESFPATAEAFFFCARFRGLSDNGRAWILLSKNSVPAATHEPYRYAGRDSRLTAVQGSVVKSILA